MSADQRNTRSTRSKKNAEDLKRRGVQRRTGMCPWGCGSTYAVNLTGLSGGEPLLQHLRRCEGGGAKKRNRLNSPVSRMARRGKR